MRLFLWFIFCCLISFLITPIGGLILFLLILFTRRKRRPVNRNVSTSVIVHNNLPSSLDRKINVSEEIERLHNLKQKGVLTPEEFELKKKRLLQ